jgi:hypothetical protein
VKYKVAFLCNWGNSSAELLAFLARQTPGGQGVWGNVAGAASPDQADYLVVLEDLPKSLRNSDIDLQRTIFLPREPSAVRARKNYESFRSPLGFTHHDIYQSAVWRVMRPFDELDSRDYINKELALSSVTSAARETSGHLVRTKFLGNFVRKYPETLHVYGYGWKDELGASYKGEVGTRFAKITDFRALCKLPALKAYRYSLAFENCRQNNYFSEKALDCWLAWSMPIYWGCPNMSEYFPDGSFHEIDPTTSDCVDKVAEIVSRPISRREISAMQEARQLILHRYNIWATVDDIIAGRRTKRPARSSFLQRVVGRLRSS